MTKWYAISSRAKIRKYPHFFMETCIDLELCNDNDDDDDLVFYVPFNIIQIISRQWKGENERLCAMKHHTVMS